MVPVFAGAAKSVWRSGKMLTRNALALNCDDAEQRYANWRIVTWAEIETSSCFDVNKLKNIMTRDQLGHVNVKANSNPPKNKISPVV